MIFLEPKRLYNGPFDGHHDRPVTPWTGRPGSVVPTGYYTVPLDSAAIVRPGNALTVLTYGTTVHVSLTAAEETGIDAGSSTCAACGRWIWTPSSTRSRRPAAAWWCMKPRAPAASAPS